MMPEDRKLLYSLIEQWTRAEIMARFMPFHWTESGDYYFQHMQRENQIRELMFGTANLVELGERWEILKEIRSKEKERIERNKGKPKGIQDGCEHRRHNKDHR